MTRDEPDPQSAVILARPAEARSIVRLLEFDGLPSLAVTELGDLIAAMPDSAFAVVTDDALSRSDISLLARAVDAQADWSDYPFVLLTEKGDGSDRDPVLLGHMQTLGNVTFLESPFHPLTFASVTRTALASRRRQYQSRDRLAEVERSRAEIAHRDERLSFALEAGRLGAWELDFGADRQLTASAICRSHFGLSANAPFGFGDFQEALHPDDRVRVVAAAQSALDARSDFEIDARIVTPSGEERWVELRGRATARDGEAPLMAGVSLDITARKLAETRQHLLIRELHHRVKNTLSTVQAIVGSTARGASSVEQFYRDFSGRIISLAQTHTILTEELWQRASLGDLIGKELALYDSGGDRITVSGPPIELPSESAVPLGMAFHELTANAARYGALSNGEGRVAVEWHVTEDPAAGHDTIHLSWTEAGGPPVQPPVRKGFGSRLLERVLAAQLKADVRVTFPPGGVRVLISFPTPHPHVAGPLQDLS